MTWENFYKELTQLNDEDMNRIVDTAIRELENITGQLQQVKQPEDKEQLESIIWANVLTVSASLRSFSTWSKSVDWIRKKLEEWLKKYLPVLKAAIKTLAKAVGALSYTITVGFPFNISVSINWSP